MGKRDSNLREKVDIGSFDLYFYIFIIVIVIIIIIITIIIAINEHLVRK